MALDTATFNGIAIGDKITDVSSSRISREIISRQLLGKDGHSHRDRGGGEQTIEITAYKDCASTYARLDYVRNLTDTFGNASASLVVEVAGGTQTWTNCIWVDSAPVEEKQNVVVFTLTFKRSAF